MLGILLALILGLVIGFFATMMMRVSVAGEDLLSTMISSISTGKQNTSSIANILGFKFTPGKSIFVDTIDKIENKIVSIAQGAMCNIFHDPSLMDMIPDTGNVKCSDIITQIESEKEKLSDMMNTINDDDMSDVEKVQRVLYTELVTLSETLTDQYCSDGETMIENAIIKGIINDVRVSVCEGFDINPITFKEYSEKVTKEGLVLGEALMKSQGFDMMKTE